MVAMLTSIKSSFSTVQYFQQDGYYAKNDPEHQQASKLYSKGADEIELADHVVEPRDFEEILSNEVFELAPPWAGYTMENLCIVRNEI